MRAVQVAIGVDHLRFHPQAEIHAEPVDVIDQALQPVGEFLRIDGPIAQPGMVVIAFAEPAIVHHEQLDSQLGRHVGELLLAGLVDVESGRFPGVVEHRAQRAT